MNGRRIRTVYLMDGFGQRTIKNVDEAFIMNLHHEGWRMDRWERVRPWRPGRKRGCIWCSKSGNICVEVWLFMASHFSKNFFFEIWAWAVTALKIGSAPQKIDPFDFLVSRTVFSSKKTPEKNKKSWAIVSFKKWAFMILWKNYACES